MDPDRIGRRLRGIPLAHEQAHRTTPLALTINRAHQSSLKDGKGTLNLSAPAGGEDVRDQITIDPKLEEPLSNALVAPSLQVALACGELGSEPRVIQITHLSEANRCRTADLRLEPLLLEMALQLPSTAIPPTKVCEAATYRDLDRIGFT